MDAFEFRTRRKRVEKTQTEAANVLGLHHTMLVHFEKGRVLLRPDQLFKLKEWLDTEEKKFLAAHGRKSWGRHV